VEPQNDGNVGAVARTMANFGFRDLVLVSPCTLTDEAYKRAKHAGDILEQAQVVDDLEAAVSDCFLVVGTSGIVSQGEGHYARIPLTARELAERLRDHEERIALVFGREDLGLSQEQLLRCDLLVHIPSHEDYPVLNLSHAVTVVLYEVYVCGRQEMAPRPASNDEKERMYRYFSELLAAIKYPGFRRKRTDVMFRRMMGRAVPTRYEYYTIMGIFGDAAKRIRELEAREKVER